MYDGKHYCTLLPQVDWASAFVIGKSDFIVFGASKHLRKDSFTTGGAEDWFVYFWEIGFWFSENCQR